MPRAEVANVVRFDAPLGARVSGIDPTVVPSGATAGELRRLLDDDILLLFRGHRSPSHQELIDFAAGIGPLRPSLADESWVPGHPGINLVSNVQQDGRLIGTGGAGVIDWHSDLRFEPPATRYIVLDAVEIPGGGAGTTRFGNLYRAYQALSHDMQTRVDGVKVSYMLPRHGYVNTSEQALSQVQAVTHDLVQVNPRTGRRSLWPNVGIFTGEVVAGDGDAALLQELYEHCIRREFTYTHEWQAGDLLIWDNVATMHRREPFDASQRRVMRHVNIVGA
jgi:alpha-ketoglutarate-dependent taurine dioxygenase